MAQLAIKGHSTRGNEVIEILEMLGGINNYKINNTEENLLYCLREGDNVIIATYPNSSITSVFTLEDFLEKFPYKVGDKVHHIIDNENQIITDLIWDGDEDEVLYKTTNNFGYVYVNYLQPYKEETTNKAIFETNAQCCDIMNNIIKKYMKEIKIDIPEGYEFFGVDDDNKIVLTEKQPQYPKTYKECCKVLNTYCTMPSRPGYKEGLIAKFQELLICRDAYWKIAGEELKLDKPWEPDFTNYDEERYGIYTLANKVERDFCGVGDVNMVLSFPTEEMRDTFYNNFKDLIEQCKELL